MYLPNILLKCTLFCIWSRRRDEESNHSNFELQNDEEKKNKKTQTKEKQIHVRAHDAMLREETIWFVAPSNNKCWLECYLLQAETQVCLRSRHSIARNEYLFNFACSQEIILFTRNAFIRTGSFVCLFVWMHFITGALHRQHITNDDEILFRGKKYVCSRIIE